VRAKAIGRVEIALDKDLRDRPDIGHAERAALRVQARACDRAESSGDTHLISEASGVYLTLRSAAGLTAGPAPVSDSFAELLAELNRPSPGVRDTT
jgi:hypothetical protein